MLVVASELPPGPGGIGAHAHAIAVELARHGRSVELLGSQHYASASEVAAFNRASAVPVRSFSDGPDPVRTARRRLAELHQAIADHKPEVIVASGGRVQWLVATARRRTSVPVVAVVHGTELGGPIWQQQVTRRALGRAQRIVAVSQYTADLTRAFGLADRRIDVVLNGADGDRFGPDPARRRAFRTRHGIADRPMVLTVGNVTQRKGQHLVVAALPEILLAVPDAIYVCVGSPTDRESLERLARGLGVEDHLLLLGQVSASEVVDAHAAADVFAMTSTTTGSGDVEGFGIAVVEAALCSVPAVVTRGTGAQEALADGETGLVVDQTPRGVAQGLSTLLGEAPRRQAMGAAAQIQALANGTWRIRAAAYGELLDDVVTGARPKILVVSHTEHYRNAGGDIVAFGPTTRELDHLATLASELVHLAPLHDGPPPGMALPVQAANIRFAPVRPAGGPRSVDRWLALKVVPSWIRTINRELASADVVHVRCPAGISAVALGVLFFRRRPRDRWVKYAGNWSPDGPDALTYRLQRAWLRSGRAKAAVTVNGAWPDQPPWVRTFDNPTLTADELRAGRDAAERKPAGPPYRVVFAGRLEGPKGADTAVAVVRQLRRNGHDVELDLVGDGPLRSHVESEIEAEGGAAIRLHGWIRRDELEAVLAAGHVLLLPTTASEGFPKVIAEAMAFGCVPVTSGISSIGQVLGQTGGSVVVTDGHWRDAVERALGPDGHRLRAEALERVERFSYTTYLQRLRTIAAESWCREL